MSEHPYTDYQKQSKRKITYLIAGIGSLFSLMILALLFATSQEDAVKQERPLSDDVIDLLNSDSISGVTSPENQDEINLSLPQGGWVQQTDSLGKLVQQYRCETLDPNPANLPNGWIEMKKPEVELFLSDNRILRITGDHGIANAPKRILESGEIAGHVVVSMYDASDWDRNKINATPSMVLTTPQASFDNFIGEITCESEVRLEATNASLSGRKMTIRFNDHEGRIEYLHLAELDYIDLYPADKVLPPLQNPSRQAALPAPKKYVASSRVSAAMAPPILEHYIATLSENVYVVQGEDINSRTASGERMTIAFSKNATTENKQTTASTLFTNGIHSHIASVAITTTDVPEIGDVTRITCDAGMTLVPLYDERLFPSTDEETRIELFGSMEDPVILTDASEGLHATALKLSHEIQSSRTDLFGTPTKLLKDDFEIESNHVWIANNDGVGGAEGQGTMRQRESSTVGTSLQWSGGVDFTFDTTHSNAIKQVVCKDNVVLVDPESTLTCSELEVNFKNNASGSSAPSVAIATMNVKAVSETQTLWADKATVTFGESTDAQHEDLFGQSKAEEMEAVGDVQVLLSDGGRAFCNTLFGDIGQEKATLTGNVVVAYDQLLMNRGEEAMFTLNRTTGKGFWNGAGQALFLQKPIDVSAPKRIDRPTISLNTEDTSQSISMRANWYHDMEIDQLFNDGAGAITLGGEVDVRSAQSPLDRSQMTGDELRLEFVNKDSTEQETQRLLDKVIAKDNAQIEHRSWETPAHDSPPVVYYIGGDHIEYVPKTQETLAVGNGELVLRDPRTPHITQHQSSLAGRGTTRFTWSEKLNTTQLSKTLYRVSMTGNVEMVHKGLDHSVGMLTSDQIEAIAIDPSTGSTDASGTELSMRGMDLKQLKATGAVYVATETRRVDCDIFDYNLQTGFAELSALENKTVAIVTDGANYPVRAKSVLWNMDPAVDSITIRGLQGTGGN